MCTLLGASAYPLPMPPQRPRGIHVWATPPFTPDRAGLLLDWQERDGVHRALVVSIGRYGSEFRDGRFVTTITSATRDELQEIAEVLRDLRQRETITAEDLADAVAPLGALGQTLLTWVRENANLIGVEVLVGFVLLLIGQVMNRPDQSQPTEIHIDQVVIGDIGDGGAAPSPGTGGPIEP